MIQLIMATNKLQQGHMNILYVFINKRTSVGHVGLSDDFTMILGFES